MKICLTSAEGGHLSELLRILDAFKEEEIFFVTVKEKSTIDLRDISKVYFIPNGPKERKILGINIHFFLIGIYYFYLIWPCLNILIKESPNVVVSTGGQATLTLSYLAKLFKIKIIYVESLTRIQELSMTGRLVYPISDLFLVQWKSLTYKYKKSKYWGKII
ncbi:PssD/Cps14F family polysaccharide biosynthesis glycosyltransferase [Methanobacterium oryzae]|uniref:PssD/Cps14F family polysaccharide biosynthesis glycosyltransferase n=1 Tax=Methanobacterium oryzae TaxID=69540 RepID=UPI003D235AE1